MSADKRRSKRIPVTMRLSISSIYKEDEQESGIFNLDSPIKIIEMSRHGLAFTSACVLPDGYCFNASFNFDDETPDIFTEVKIVRSEAISARRFMYGCEFTNLPENVAEIIDKYSVEE